MRNLAILFVLLWSTVAGAVPKVINFTGRLTTSSGPVNGAVNITLGLFTDAVGGKALWNELHNSVGADNGLVFLELGKGTTLDETVLDGRQLYLEITVENETLAPRLPLNSVPYAVRTDAATTADLLGGSITAADVVTSVNGGAGVVANRSSTNGVSVSLSSCTTTGQILKWNQSTSTWTCQADNDTPVTPGSGITVSGSTVSLTSCTTTGQILKWNATTSTWGCQADNGTTYTSGTGIAVNNGNTTISLASCTTTGQILKWNQSTSTWTCQADDSVAVTAGSGITVSGSTVSLTSCTTTGQILKWNQSTSTWTCQADNGATYTSGTGIAVNNTNTTISLASCTATGQILKWNQSTSTWTCQADDNTAPTAGSGIAVSGSTVSLTSCTATGQILKWNQSTSTWTCQADANTVVTAAAPLNITGGALSISGTGCSMGQVLQWNGAAFVCSSPFTTNSCTWRVVINSTAQNFVLATCPATKHVMSGGCDAAGAASVTDSRPGDPPGDGDAASTQTAWFCEFSTSTVNHTAYALCCNTI